MVAVNINVGAILRLNLNLFTGLDKTVNTQILKRKVLGRINEDTLY